MKFENQKFEQQGLKIDKERVLTFSQLNCPLDCRYCFVEDMNYNQKSNVAYLDEKQLGLLQQLPDEVKLVMLGCDTEFFQGKANSLEILQRLSALNKDFSVITKLNLQRDFIKKIKEIDSELRKHGNFLSFSVSLPAIDSAQKWEPKAPSPDKRIETLKMAHEEGLMTMLALRPLLPSVTDEELEKIIESTKDYAYGYYSGPLYLKELDPSLVQKDDPDLSIAKEQPSWMPAGNEFYKVLRNGQMDKLKALLAKYDKPLFEGAAEGIEYLKNYEKHRT